MPWVLFGLGSPLSSCAPMLPQCSYVHLRWRQRWWKHLLSLPTAILGPHHIRHMQATQERRTKHHTRASRTQVTMAVKMRLVGGPMAAHHLLPRTVLGPILGASHVSACGRRGPALWRHLAAEGLETDLGAQKKFESTPDHN